MTEARRSRLQVRGLTAAALLLLAAGCAQGPAAEDPDNGGPDPATDYQVPIETWSLDNGARVLYVHRPELPMMSLKVAFDAGSARDPEGKFGLSALTARMLDQGAGELSADQFARRVDDLGLNFGAGNGRDQLSVRVTSLTKGDTTAKAWGLLTTALTEPAFGPGALARERNRLLTAIERDKEDPQQVGLKAFYRKVYGDHPYAHPSEGEPDGLKAIERSDLEAFAERYFVGRNATIAVVGAMEPSAVKDLLGDTLGRLPAGEAPPSLAEVPDLEGPREVFIDKEVSQAQILMGQPGTTRDAEDYFPLLVGNYSLGGGGFVSRLVSVVREEYGLSYSVFSTFAPLTRRGPFVAGLQTANDNVPKALSLLQKEVASFVREGPTADEVDAAQRYLTGSFPLKLESNQDLRGQLATLGFYGLGPDYLERYLARIRSVDAGDIEVAMADRLDPERMVTVIVGAVRPEGFGEGGD
ncbi:M16 family metallopeptidase [Thiohalorhabdus sp.]|uniref:M16 family metallopeptidase n=1 Tax=Thiohalorhabdus sp. TaxID=3094134 RepID=UPI002FC3DBAB